jgi:hypothetical protein
MSELKARMRKHYAFSKLEFREFLIVAVIVGLALGFDDGQPTFELMHWLVNLAICIGIAFFTVMVHISAQKGMSLLKGYMLEYKLFLYGVLGGALVSLVSFGRIVLFPAFELIFSHHEGLRLGRFRYGLNFFEMATVVMMGPIANFLLAIVLKILYSVFPSFILYNALKLNVLYAIANMLPIPKTAGSYLFFGSPALFFWVFAPITLAGVLVLFVPRWSALAFGLGAGAVVAITYFFKIEYR